MTGDTLRRDAAQSIIELCRAGLDPETLRERLLPRLRRAVPADGLWWATSDPATLLFTSTYQEQIPERTKPFFIENEFVNDDVNKWVDVARHPGGVRTLHEATRGAMTQSPRYTQIFNDLGFGDELRAAFSVHGSCWGFLCLHREAGLPFSPADTSFIANVAPHVALGIRAGLVAGMLDTTDAVGAPGVLLFDRHLAITGRTRAAERWLEELGFTDGPNSLLPTEILALAARVRDGATPESRVPRLRVRTLSGRWAVLHGSRMPANGREAIAIIIDQASPAEVAPIIMLAYGLSEQERTITGLVCRGLSTAEIAVEAGITVNTVQDHLKSIFDKVGIRSRRELVVQILRDHYVPKMQARRPLGPTGYFS
jgi:DNA-binding CsgD family transcriptional regulator